MTATDLLAKLAGFPCGQWTHRIMDQPAGGTFIFDLDRLDGQRFTGQAPTLAKAMEEALRKADGDA